MLKFVKRQSRGCGIRNERGFYIMCGGIPISCHRLPLDIPICGECGQYMIPYKIRGVAKFDARRVLGMCAAGIDPDTDLDTHVRKYPCHAWMGCSVCFPPEKGWYMAVGEDSYSVKSFNAETALQGISKKVRSVPLDMKKGDILYLGFRKAVFDCHAGEDGEGEWIPQIFCAAPITGFEKLVSRAQIEDKEYMENLEERGIDAIIEYDDPAEVADLQDHEMTKPLPEESMKDEEDEFDPNDYPDPCYDRQSDEETSVGDDP
jgi:hypothetical protein